MLTLSLPEKSVWDAPLGDTEKSKGFNVEEINGVCYLKPKIMPDRRTQIRQEQRKLAPILGRIHEAAKEALDTVSAEQKKRAEVWVKWTSIHRSGRPLELICHKGECAELDHVVLLSAKNYPWPSSLDRLFPALPIVTTLQEQEADATVISLDGRRHKLDIAGIPEEVRFIYPKAIEALIDRIEDREGPLYDFYFKIERPAGENSSSFTAILKLH